MAYPETKKLQMNEKFHQCRMINNILIDMIIDTGASADALDEIVCHKVTL